MRRSEISKTVLIALACLFLARPARAAAATASYTVSINTAPLVGHPAGPFSILIAFTDGSGVADSNNTVLINQVDFGGGSGLGDATLFGSVSGALESGVNITDVSPLNFFSESFSPGQFLRFTLTLTTGDDDGGTPDRITLYILDASGNPIPTLSPSADFLLGSDLGSTFPLPTAFGTDATRSPSAGNPILIDAPIVTPVDKVPPTTSAILSPHSNVFGWNNSDVLILLTSLDNPGGAGVKQITYSASGAQPIASMTIPSTTTSFTINIEGITTVTFFGTDNVGNVETAKTITIKLDKTPPTISGSRTPGPNVNGWNNTDVTVSFTCSDSLSGVAPSSPPAATVFSQDGSNQLVSGSCQDLAGNSATATVQGINIDKTAPTVSCSANPAVLWPPNHELVPINVTVAVSDSLSGPAGFTLNSVTSNEPDSGQGDIHGFVIGTASTNGQLRAERLGSGDGRVYTIGYTGIDRAGNPTTCNTNVSVPHDQGH